VLVKARLVTAATLQASFFAVVTLSRFCSTSELDFAISVPTKARARSSMLTHS
jgi:hypothetical protein